MITPSSDAVTLRARLDAGETVLGSFINLGSTLTAEILGLAGFDWLVIDLEHGAGNEQLLVGQLQALAHTGATALVWVEGIEPARVLHALDAGAAGVLVPRLRTLDDARRAVEYCRYAGRRGVARYNRSWQWGLRGGTLAEADARVICAVQIETAEALDAVAEIAAVDGVDLVFVGPADLAHSLGLACPPDDPELLERVAAVAAAACAHGKAAGVLDGTAEQAAAYYEAGFRFLGCASDSGLLATAARGVLVQLRALATVNGERRVAAR
jgi:2-dehydro-3-deoxyglucarate aldolase/4-hydroxy-2-oxoheptanedioate aldolase